MTLAAPPDLRPGALMWGGLSRGVLLVFVPVALVGQAIAWIAYAISGAYAPWSWVKIGLAYALAGVRVPFDVTTRGHRTLQSAPPVEHGTLIVALGALTVLTLVLAFRAGRAQARGLERRPVQAAIAGAMIAPGFAVPMAIASFAVILGFPNLGVTRLEPVHWASLVAPLLVGVVVGAIGGVSAAADTLTDAGGWRASLVVVGRSGWTALWLGVAFAFVGFLVLAAVELDATRAYGRFVGSGTGGALLVVHHALLLPNQSVMILATAMGSPTLLTVGDAVSTVSITGIHEGPAGLLFPSGVDFPAWYWAFLLVPAGAAALGGRLAANGARRRPQALARAALGGLLFAALAGVAAWAASISAPFPLFGDATPTLGPSPLRTTAVAVLWGVLGMSLGALATWRAP